MSDQELRDRILARLYEVRHQKDHVVLPHELNMPEVGERVLAGILKQLRSRGHVRWQRISGGECRGALNITDRGIQLLEEQNAPPKVKLLKPKKTTTPPPPPVLTPQAHPTHTLLAWVTLISALALIVAGVVLVWMKSEGTTEISLFGTKFSSGNIGALGIFCAVVLVGVNIRRILKSVERLSTQKR